MGSELIPFSPLFIAAMVATDYSLPVSVIDAPFSPLFIAAMVATGTDGADGAVGSTFQSAFHRGNGLLQHLNWLLPQLRELSGPLFIAAMVATRLARFRQAEQPDLSVRFSSRQWLLRFVMRLG